VLKVKSLMLRGTDVVPKKLVISSNIVARNSVRCQAMRNNISPLVKDCSSDRSVLTLGCAAIFSSSLHSVEFVHFGDGTYIVRFSG